MIAAKRMTRRDFLKVAGVTVGAGALVTGLGIAVTRGPAAPEPQVETPVFVYGKENSMKRILVTYATRTGSTVGVAAAIGEALGARGFAVDVKPSKDQPAIDGYAAVVLGSAVNGGQWLPEAVDFIKQNRQALNRVPVALFSVHIMNLGDDEKSKRNRLAYLDAVRPLLKPLDEAFFAGMGADATSSRFDRWLYRTFNMGPEGDCRDWSRIRGWAQSVAV